MCRSYFSLILLCLLMSFGCGGKSAASLDATGKVTVNGAPAQHVTVTLTDADGHSFSGTTDEEGKFLIAAVTPGEKTVTISANKAVDPTTIVSATPKVEKNTKPGLKSGGGPPPLDQKSKDKMKQELSAKGADAKFPTPPEVTKIPTKYSDSAKSGLTWNVSPENLSKDFNLSD